MSRRPLVLLALAISSFVATACSDISAPRRDGEEPEPGTCRSGYIGMGGRCEE